MDREQLLDWAPPITGEPAFELQRHTSGKAIIHRDQVHGDVQYDPLTVALLNTDALQRLGRVLQLGYSHLVFRGGTHTRLSHVMGAAHMAGKIVDCLRMNYKQKRAARPRHVIEPQHFLPCENQYLENDRWEILRHLVTWAALLHDLGHIPMGHTLEDEFEGIFKKHDDLASPRSLVLWGRNSAIFKTLTDESLYPEAFRNCKVQPLKVWQAVMLICYYKDSVTNDGRQHASFSDSLTNRITIAKSEIQKIDKEIKISNGQSNKSERVEAMDQKETLKAEISFSTTLFDAIRGTKDIFRPFMTDIVANTICADYLDYVRRDPLNVGLDVLRDDRILSHFYVSAEPKSRTLRMALALVDRHAKPRLDVCTGVVEQVRQRYRFAETIYYHKTKVSASAMFAKAMSLIGKPAEIAPDQTLLFEDQTNPSRVARQLLRRPTNFKKIKNSCLPSALLHPEIGDDSVHLFMILRALDNIEDELSRAELSRATGRKLAAAQKTRIVNLEQQLRGIALLQAIVRRHLYKVSMSINAVQFGRLTKGSSPEGVVEERLQSALDRLRKDKGLRERIEMKMTEVAGWPPDSILLYAPPRKSQAKGIETFAFDKDGVVRLNEHPAVSEKVNELGRDYQKLWKLLVLIHPGCQGRTVELSEAIDVLIVELWRDFADDGLEVNLHDPERVSIIRDAAWFPYIRKDHREAARELQALSSDALGVARPIDWDLFERAPIMTTLSEETLTSTQYAERAFLLQRLCELYGTNESAEQQATADIKERFALPTKTIVSSNQKALDAEFASSLVEKKEFLSDAQKVELRRALELDDVAAEMFSNLRSTRRPAKPHRFPSKKQRSEGRLSGTRRSSSRSLSRRTEV